MPSSQETIAKEFVQLIDVDIARTVRKGRGRFATVYPKYPQMPAGRFSG